MEKHLNCAYLRRYIYNTLEAGGLKHYVSLNPDVRNSPRNRSAERNCIWPLHANRFPSGGAVVLSFAFAKQLNLLPIAFLNGETEMLWYCGLIKCFLFWSSSILPVLDQLCKEHMESVAFDFQHNGTQCRKCIFKHSIIIINFRNKLKVCRKASKTIKHPTPIRSLPPLRWRVENKASQSALQHLHFHSRSCWRLGRRNDECISAAMMHFWLLFRLRGCWSTAAFYCHFFKMLRDHITNPRGNNITPGRVHSLASAAASHLMPLHIPRLYHIYIYIYEWKHFYFR